MAEDDQGNGAGGTRLHGAGRPPRVLGGVGFALFMVEALTDGALVQEAPAIVGRRTPSAHAHHHRHEPDAAPTRADI